MKKLLLGAALMCSFMMVQAQTADEIVAKYVTATGGKENIDKLKSLVMEGAMSAAGNSINVTVTKVAGKLSRQDISAMGMNGFMLMTDKGGWTYLPFAGQQKAEAMSDDMVKAGMGNLD